MKTDAHDLINIQMVAEGDKLSVGVLQTPLLTDVVEGQDTHESAHMTMEFIGTIISTITQMLPDSEQNNYLEFINESLKNSSTDDIIDLIVNCDRTQIQEE